MEESRFLVTNSSLPILLVTHVGDIPPEKDYNPPATLPQAGPSFAGNIKATFEIRKLAEVLPNYGHLVLNFDDETVRKIKNEIDLRGLTFGFQEGADFRATDIKLNTGTNFKVNYKGNVVPVWLEKPFGREQIYAVLSAMSVGVIFNLNLIEISQTLKNYQTLPKKI